MDNREPNRKMPGPASKTLLRQSVPGIVRNLPSPAPSTMRPNLPGPSNPGSVTMNTVSRSQSYAVSVAVGPELSSNDVSRPNANIQPMRQSESIARGKSFPETARTSCLFCKDPIVISMLRADVLAAEKTEVISQLVENLCRQMNMDHTELSIEYTQMKFPFCESCVELLEEMLESQRIIDEEQTKIAERVAEVERIVADAEILNPSSSQPVTSSEEKKCTKLPMMILEVYRKKVVIQKKLKKDSINNRRHLQNQGSHPSTSRSESRIIESTHYEEVENVTMDEIPEYFNNASTEEGSSDESALQEWNVSESLQDEENLQNDDDHNLSTQEESSLEDPRVQYDANNCTLVISIVRGGNNTPFVKQEPSLIPIEDDDDVDYIESHSSDAASTPIGTGSQKRKLLHNGIEIFRGTNPGTGRQYLQCSLCLHRVPMMMSHEKRGISGSVYVNMKIHINNEHLQKRKPGRPKKQNPAPVVLKKLKTFSCTTCRKEFPKVKLLRAHEKVHTIVIPCQICDICQRPVKGWAKNLMAHKFSHKNDEERRAAIAAGEPGASNTLLSKKMNVPLFQNKYKYVPKPKKYKTKPKQLAATPDNNVALEKKFACDFCPRRFIKRCYKVLHEKSHKNDNNSSPPVLTKMKPIRLNNGRETIESAAASHSSTHPVMDFAMPPGASLEDVTVEENDDEMSSSSDEGNGWIDYEDVVDGQM